MADRITLGKVDEVPFAGKDAGVRQMKPEFHVLR